MRREPNFQFHPALFKFRVPLVPDGERRCRFQPDNPHMSPDLKTETVKFTIKIIWNIIFKEYLDFALRNLDNLSDSIKIFRAKPQENLNH